MSKYHSNRIDEYIIKERKHEEYIEELNRIVQKRNILFKEVKSMDNNDGTVESYEYDQETEIIRSRLINLDGRIRHLKRKVERTG